MKVPKGSGHPRAASEQWRAADGQAAVTAEHHHSMQVPGRPGTRTVLRRRIADRYWHLHTHQQSACAGCAFVVPIGGADDITTCSVAAKRYCVPGVGAEVGNIPTGGTGVVRFQCSGPGAAGVEGKGSYMYMVRLS